MINMEYKAITEDKLRDMTIILLQNKKVMLIYRSCRLNLKKIKHIDTKL